MEFKISVEELLKALGRTQGVAERKTSIPILANVLIEASSEGIVRFTTFDLDIAISSEHPAEVAKAGAITLPAKMMNNLARTMSMVGSEVHISVDGVAANIVCGKARCRVTGVSADDYPKIPSVDQVDLCKVNSKALIDLIAKTAFSVSRDETRPTLHGLFFEAPEKGTMRAVSTDGHRLSLMSRKVEDGELSLERGVIFPFKGLGELKKILDEAPDAESFIGFNDSSAIFKRQGLTMVMRLIDGQFPEYREVIPQGDVNGVKVGRKELINYLNTQMSIIDSRASAVRINLDKGVLKISSKSESNDGSSEIPVDYEGEPIEIGFNANYLKDALSVIDSDQVNFGIMDEQSPGVITPVGGSDFVAVIMPMRL